MGWGQLLGSAVGSYFGGPVGGGFGAAIGGAFDQSSANRFSQDEAAKNRETQADLSNTAYQRAMADMKAAGLNPMLAFSQGGASVPTGSTATWSNAVDSSQSSAAALQTSRAAETSASASAKQAETQSRLVDASVDKIKQDIEHSKTDQARMNEVIRHLAEDINLMQAKRWNLTEMGDQIRATVRKLNQETYYWREHGLREEILKHLDDLDLSAARKLDNFGREAQQLLPFFQILRSILRPR